MCKYITSLSFDFRSLALALSLIDIYEVIYLTTDKTAATLLEGHADCYTL